MISQRCYLCTGSHDPGSAAFGIFALPITIGSQCWLAGDVFGALAVTIAGQRAGDGVPPASRREISGG